jgi:hypothetical protein
MARPEAAQARGRALLNLRMRDAEGGLLGRTLLTLASNKVQAFGKLCATHVGPGKRKLLICCCAKADEMRRVEGAWMGLRCRPTRSPRTTLWRCAPPRATPPCQPWPAASCTGACLCQHCTIVRPPLVIGVTEVACKLSKYMTCLVT